MLFAIYTRAGKKDLETISEFVNKLQERGHQFVIHKSKKTERFSGHSACHGLFAKHEELVEAKPDFLISFGGDGTVLDSMLYVLDSNIPIAGCNTGRLGFLSTANSGQLNELIQTLENGDHKIGSRSVLMVDGNLPSFNGPQYALNDVSIHKRDTSAMITVDTFLDNSFFNTYWADGVLISTPTGSTAYSLSCGGPLMFPNSSGFIINPVAPHNLNVRPVVVSNNTVIKLKVKGRGTKFLMSLDSRYKVVSYGQEITIQKAPFKLNFVELDNHDFVKRLREKLNWGKDHRNN